MVKIIQYKKLMTVKEIVFLGCCLQLSNQK